MIAVSIRHQLNMLSDLLETLTDDQYTFLSPMIGGYSIGQHTRHILELFQALENGYDSALVDYDQRKRDVQIETDRICAHQVAGALITSLVRNDKPLRLRIDGPGEDRLLVESSYYRELAYNIEHTIHHFSLIRVVLRELHLDCVPPTFGFAYSTLRKQKATCAQ